jgi:hypothetical protein
MMTASIIIQGTKRFGLYFVLGVSLFAAIGCETVSSSQLSESAAQNIKRVGVVSIAGDTLFHDHVGVTAFGNKVQTFDVTEWALDNNWESKIETAVQSAGEFEVVDIVVDREELKSAYPSGEKGIIATYRIPKFKRITEDLKKIASENGVDALIILAGDAAELYGTNQVLENFGVLVSGRIFSSATAQIYMTAKIYLIDGATGEVLAKRWLAEKHGLFSSPYAFFEVAPKIYAQKPFSELSGEEKTFLRDQFVAGPEKTWAPTVELLLAPKPN